MIADVIVNLTISLDILRSTRELWILSIESQKHVENLRKFHLQLLRLLHVSRMHVNAQNSGETIEAQFLDEVRYFTSRVTCMMDVESQYGHCSGERDNSYCYAVVETWNYTSTKPFCKLTSELHRKFHAFMLE